MRCQSLGSVLKFVLRISLLIAVAKTFAAEEAKIDFSRDVAPILQQQCVVCHGPEMQMAELRLDQRKFVLGSDADPDLVKVGKSNESLLLKRLVDRKLGILMPPSFPFPPGEKVGLPETAIQTLKAWIDQGAQWPEGLNLASQADGDTASAKSGALFAAIRAGDHRAAVELLKNEKELAKARNRHGETPLMYAGVYSDAAMVKLLLERGADVNAISPDGATALMRAAGNLTKVELLLAGGATADAKSKMGRTALLIAAATPGNVKAVKLLLARGANVNDKDQYGDTCLTSAAKRGDGEMVKALLAAGANVAEGSSWPGQAPLIWASEAGDLPTLAALLEHGAGKIQPHLDIALASAAMRGWLAGVRLLIDHKANPNAPSPFAGYTPLMLAVYCDDVDVELVRLLLDKGADRKASGKNGETPLSLAKKRGRTAVVELLEKAGGGE